MHDHSTLYLCFGNAMTFGGRALSNTKRWDRKNGNDEKKGSSETSLFVLSATATNSVKAQIIKPTIESAACERGWF